MGEVPITSAWENPDIYIYVYQYEYMYVCFYDCMYVYIGLVERGMVAVFRGDGFWECRVQGSCKDVGI